MTIDYTEKAKSRLWNLLWKNCSKYNTISKASIILLGKKGSGKKALLKAIQEIAARDVKLNKLETYKDSNGIYAINYACLNLKSENILDDAERLCEFWIMQEKTHQRLLETFFDMSSTSIIAYMICIDICKFWNIMNTLKEWLAVCSELTQFFLSKLPYDKQEYFRERIASYLDSYRKKNCRNIGFDDENSIPCINWGFPVIVCITKCNELLTTNNDTFSRISDLLVAELRETCYRYNAALFFISSMDSSARSMKLLYAYLLHRLYSREFQEPGSVSQIESLFLPSGWDTLAEIRSLVEKTSSAAPFKYSIDCTEEMSERSNGEITIPRSMNSFLESLLLRNPKLLQKNFLENNDGNRNFLTSHSRPLMDSPSNISSRVTMSLGGEENSSPILPCEKKEKDL